MYIKNDDPYEVTLESKSVYDMSEYPKKSKFHGPTIKINYRHIDVLKDIVKQYNQNIHSSVKETSYDIYHDDKKPNAEFVYTVGKRPIFKVVDNVRISVVKGNFENGYNQEIHLF